MHNQFFGVPLAHTLSTTLLLLITAGCTDSMRQPQPPEEQQGENPIAEKSSTATASMDEPEPETLTDKPNGALATFDLRSAAIVSLIQLDGFAKGRPFYYVGSDESWHYFKVNGTHYRLSQKETLPPTPPENGAKALIGYVGLPMEFTNGKLSVRYPTDEFPTGSF